jgi:hypothetical protein
MKKLLLMFIYCFCCTLQVNGVEIAIVTWAGNGADDRDISVDVGGQIGVLWIWNNSTHGNCWKSTSMAGDLSFDWNAGSQGANRIQSLGVNTFQVGTDNNVNANGVTYYAVAFRDDNTDDIYIGTYAGNGNDDRNLDLSCGFTPDYAMVQNTDGTNQAIFKTSTLAGDASFRCNVGDGIVANYIQDLIEDGIQLGTNSRVNANGDNYYVFLLKEVAGLIDCYEHTGNGVDDRNVTLSDFTTIASIFTIQGGAGTADLKYSDINVQDDDSEGTCATDVAQAYSSSNIVQSISTNVIQTGDNVHINDAAFTYHWFVLAEGSSTAIKNVIIIQQLYWY